MDMIRRSKGWSSLDQLEQKGLQLKFDGWPWYIMQSNTNNWACWQILSESNIGNLQMEEDYIKEGFLRIYLLACKNLLWDIGRLPSSCRAAIVLHVILTLRRGQGANQPPYALRHRSSPCYALWNGRWHIPLYYQCHTILLCDCHVFV